MQDRKQLAKHILTKLMPLYGKAPMGIHFITPFQLVVGTILSAQCTDKRVNQVTSKFFAKLKKPEDYIRVGQKRLEKLIKSTGFYHNKAKNIIGAAKVIRDQHQGKIPSTMKELIKIPGFGRKTANAVLTRLYQVNEGVCVDTHVLRLSNRIGLSNGKGAIQVEKDLMAIVPQKQWHEITHCLILHGREVCDARRPRCEDCVLRGRCGYYGER